MARGSRLFLPCAALCALLQLPTTSQAGYAPVDPEQIKQLLSSMTLQEKLETTGIPTLAESDVLSGKVSPLDFLLKAGPTPRPESWFDLRDHERLGVRGMRTRDGPRGITCLLGGSMAFSKPCPEDGSSPSFPHGTLRAATWDLDLEEEFGRATGDIAKSLDIHAALLPCINILPWLNGGRSQESYGEDPLLNGKMGAAAVRGIQSKGVMATPKHFLANNIENTRWAVSADMDDKTLHEVYLKKWAIVVAESSPEFIMTSYNRVQGNWSNIHPKFLNLLRRKLGFQGSVMTDWFATMSFMPKMVPGSHFANETDFFGDFNSALVAGVDMEMPFNSLHLLAARRMADCSGTKLQSCTTAKALDVAVAHLLRSKLRYGLVNATAPPKEAAVYDTAKYDALSLKIARQGIVLLKNEESFLPKRPESVKSVAVLGTPTTLELGDRGSSAQKPAGRTATVLEALVAKYGREKVQHLPDHLAESETVKKADLVVLDVGLNWTIEGEFIPPGTGGDRTFLNLSSTERDLVLACSRASSNVVVAISAGSSVIVEDFVEKVKGIVWMGYPGALGGEALVDIIAGDANPAGRMPSATPKEKEDWLPTGITTEPWTGVNVSYPYAHGFKQMWGSGVAPRYPLGWGLSYTRYAYGTPTVEGEALEKVVSVEVKNEGAVEGIETVQVYATCANCKRKRLPILLVGFRRVKLAPGESKEVKIAVSAKEMAVYDEEKALWCLEKEDYSLLVGPHCDQKALKAATFNVAEDVFFDYDNAGMEPNVPGVGEQRCEEYSCVPDDDFNRMRLKEVCLARAQWLLLIALLLSFCCCGFRLLRGCCRRVGGLCCGSKKEKAKAKAS